MKPKTEPSLKELSKEIEELKEQKKENYKLLLLRQKEINY